MQGELIVAVQSMKLRVYNVSILMSSPALGLPQSTAQNLRKWQHTGIEFILCVRVILIWRKSVWQITGHNLSCSVPAKGSPILPRLWMAPFRCFIWPLPREKRRLIVLLIQRPQSVKGPKRPGRRLTGWQRRPECRFCVWRLSLAVLC